MRAPDFAILSLAVRSDRVTTGVAARAGRQTKTTKPR
jgi:hypothetical protein